MFSLPFNEYQQRKKRHNPEYIIGQWQDISFFLLKGKNK